MSGAMLGPTFRRLFAAFGLEIVARGELARERQAAADAAAELKRRLKLANGERASLSSEVARLRSALEEASTQLWAKIDKEQKRADAALRAAAQLRSSFDETRSELALMLERVATAEAKAKRSASTAPPSRAELADLRAKLEKEGALKAAIKERLREQSSYSDALATDNEALRAETKELMARLADAQANLTRDTTDDLLTILGPVPARRSELVAARLAENLLMRCGLKGRAGGDAAEYFRLGRALQMQGAFELAAAAYRKVGPEISTFLAQPGPDGRPVSGPDFLIVGAPRAGTTWLKRALSYHPEVMMLAGEPQFFAMTGALGPEYYVSQFARTGARFLRRDRKERTPARPLRPIHGEKSTTYLSMAEAQISLCAALYPKARIVCMVRDPIARAWSHIKFDGLAQFGDELRKLTEQPYWQSLDAFIRHGRYEQHLARWARHYPPEQIYLVDFARLSTDADGVYRDVLSHIGATVDSEALVPEQVNQSVDAGPPQRLKRVLQDAYEHGRHDIPWLRQVMEKAAADARRRERLTKEFRHAIQHNTRVLAEAQREQ